jgi:hypothetical protein
MLDLDTLMSGQHKEILKSDVVSSLLLTFHSTNDSFLLDKIMEVLRRCFS